MNFWTYVCLYHVAGENNKQHKARGDGNAGVPKELMCIISLLKKFFKKTTTPRLQMRGKEELRTDPPLGDEKGQLSACPGNSLQALCLAGVVSKEEKRQEGCVGRGGLRLQPW